MDLKNIFSSSTDKKVRYGIVALGDITQEAMLPGITQTYNSEVTAFVTGDDEKAQALGKMYNVTHMYHYDEFQTLLKSDQIDALYIATPNWRHAEFAVPALEAGIHVLLEKPMEISAEKCQLILDAQAKSKAKLMIAYRLHFEPSTLSLVKDIRAGKLGELRYFSACFSQMIDPDNHRAKEGDLAGPLYDMGTYPINAARYVFDDEPIEVISASSIRYVDSNLENSPDTVVATLRFPKDRIAQFIVSYSTSSINSFVVGGTKGVIEMKPAFTYGKPMAQYRNIQGEESQETFNATDQFAGEVEYFSECILCQRQPEPNGTEGLADVRIIEAIVTACEQNKSVKLEPVPGLRRIDVEGQLKKIKYKKPPEPVNTKSPVEKN